MLHRVTNGGHSNAKIHRLTAISIITADAVSDTQHHCMAKVVKPCIPVNGECQNSTVTKNPAYSMLITSQNMEKRICGPFLIKSNTLICDHDE